MIFVFTIESFDKGTDLYVVTCNNGERKCVTSRQIVTVMLRGYKFTNAKLTTKGFSIATDSGTRYVQVYGLNKQTISQMHTVVKNERQEQQPKKPMAKAKVVIKRPMNPNVPSSYIKQSTISFQGKNFRDVMEMCKYYNRNYDTYTKMIQRGYTKEEALGVVEPRPYEEVVEGKLREQRVLDRMAYNRGDL